MDIGKLFYECIIPEAMNGRINWILFFIGFILMIVTMLIAYLAIPNMAANDDSLSAAFAFSDIFNVINDSSSPFHFCMATGKN